MKHGKSIISQQSEELAAFAAEVALKLSECKHVAEYGDYFVAQASLAREVYTTIYENTEVFTVPNICPDLAYLLGAILLGTKIDLPDRERVDNERTLLSILREHFKKDSAIWGHINIV